MTCPFIVVRSMLLHGLARHHTTKDDTRASASPWWGACSLRVLPTIDLPNDSIELMLRARHISDAFPDVNRDLYSTSSKFALPPFDLRPVIANKGPYVENGDRSAPFLGAEHDRRFILFNHLILVL
mmetsp:Transcript_26947/g.77705  ORF Transcript_26947/g.77705 Transcript_26947/m.77705 type:complete len:126 (-) Transcript_26947:4168-4545(-)